MKIILTLLLFVHGLIHFMGFTKAFDFGNLAEFTKEISKPVGLFWMLTGLLFMVSGMLYFLKKESWPILAVITVVLSQVLIIMVWKDAKFGTIANLIVLITAVIGFATNHFENSYKKDVLAAFEKATFDSELINKKDLEHLPIPVQKYLDYVGVVGKPKVHNVKIVIDGEMRSKGQDWFHFTSEQYNFFDSPTRLFFMKAKVKGLTTNGYHSYKKEGARMQIKLLSIFPVVHLDIPELYPTETVTFLNDLCLFAPAALIDERITWESIDNVSARAIFTVDGTTISAMLHFNEAGQLVNFISNDRFDVNANKTFPFLTPVKIYKNVNGYNLPTYGEATWHYPDGKFVYGKFNLKSIEYNIHFTK